MTDFLTELRNKIDCGDNSCYFVQNRTGQRTNGGCRCFGSNNERNYVIRLEARIAELERELERRREAADELLTGLHKVSNAAARLALPDPLSEDD